MEAVDVIKCKQNYMKKWAMIVMSIQISIYLMDRSGLLMSIHASIHLSDRGGSFGGLSLVGSHSVAQNLGPGKI